MILQNLHLIIEIYVGKFLIKSILQSSYWDDYDSLEILPAGGEYVVEISSTYFDDEVKYSAPGKSSIVLTLQLGGGGTLYSPNDSRPYLSGHVLPISLYHPDSVALYIFEEFNGLAAGGIVNRSYGYRILE